jgi:HPt (histidine-containing phosphotransfer) domain-containing protein
MTGKDSTSSELQALRELDQRLESVRRKVNQLEQVTPSVLEEKHALEVEKFLDGVLRKIGESNEV